MTPEVVLHRKLTSASRRIRVLLAYRYASWLVLLMAGLSLAWLLASKAYWVDEPAPELLGALVLGGGILGALFGYLQRVTPLDAARITDKRTQMKERFASAVEFEGIHSTDPLVRRQIEDAGEHARALDLRRTYPVKLTRESVFAGVLALALFGAFFLPSLPIFWSAERKKEAEQVKQHGVKIEKIAQDSEKASEAKKLTEAKKASQEAKKLAKAMKAGKMGKKQAMVKLNKLTKNIAEQQKRLAAANKVGSKSLEQAAKEIKQALEQQRKAAEDALKAKPQNAGKADPKNPQDQKQSDAMTKSQDALNKFAEALQQNNPEAQNQALQELAQQMQSGQMSQKEMQQLQKQMEKIAQAMQGTDLDKAAKQLAELAKQMKSMNLDPETLKKLAQMAQKAGGT